MNIAFRKARPNEAGTAVLVDGAYIRSGAPTRCAYLIPDAPTAQTLSSYLNDNYRPRLFMSSRRLEDIPELQRCVEIHPANHQEGTLLETLTEPERQALLAHPNDVYAALEAIVQYRRETAERHRAAVQHEVKQQLSQQEA